jgi:predicted Zn-dependent peptidase
MALYILTHGYEGRLGKAAISNRGLVYYISSAWNTDGRNDWITINTGVDPHKLPAMKNLLREQLDLLITEPPMQAEIEAARSHLLGRHLSASQSNRELADSLTTQWVWHGSLISYAELKRTLDEVDQQDIMDILPAFTRGTIVSITNPVQPKQ